MISGLDSRDEPTDAQLHAAFSGGDRLWWGYYGPGAAHDWQASTFARVQAAGLVCGVIAFPVPGSPPLAAALFARSLGARLLVDNARGDGVDPFAGSTAAWLRAARSVAPVAMYGQAGVIHYWLDQIDAAVVCGVGGGSPNPLGLKVPSGNQNGNEVLAGITVDTGVYDSWFTEAAVMADLGIMLRRAGDGYVSWLTDGHAIHVASGPDAQALQGVGVPIVDVTVAMHDAAVLAYGNGAS